MKRYIIWSNLIKILYLGIAVSTSTADRKRYSAVAWIKDVNSNNHAGYICSGAWIAQDWVITIRDCFDDHGIDTVSKIKSDTR